ncbi:hypothetical protein D3C78_847270 [compost metagenome]
MISSTIGTMLSPPSRPKRLVPGNLVPRYFSRPSAAVRRSSRWLLASTENSGRPRTLSRRWANQLRCSASTMWVNSAPMVPQ